MVTKFKNTSAHLKQQKRDSFVSGERAVYITLVKKRTVTLPW